jgi:hypothetical protein
MKKTLSLILFILAMLVVPALTFFPAVRRWAACR